MSSPVLRFLRVTLLSALASFLYGVIRSARPRPTPPTTGAASWEPLVEEDPLPTRSGPVTFAAPAGAATDAPSGDASTGWAQPDEDGGCPASHPVKGNEQSKIFHVPGGGSYDRTKAERCYCDEAAAEADGYRKAKR